MAKTKEAKEEKVVDSKSILGGILKDHSEEHYNFKPRKTWNVSSGSLLIDAATGGLKPGLFRYCGNNNSGKTPSCLEAIRNIFNGVPNSKALWMIAEGRNISQENKDRCGLKFVYDFNEWDDHTVFVLESNIYEVFIKIVKELVLNNPTGTVYSFVIDSLNGLITRSDSKKEIEENSLVAGQAVLSKRMMQSLSLGMFKSGCWMGLISQVTSEIKLSDYGPKTANRGGQFSGGNTFLHSSDYIFEFQPTYNTDFILDNPNGKFNDGKTKAIGQNVKITINKSEKEASKKIQVTYPILYHRKPSGIWREREVGDTLIMWGMLAKSGSWFSFTEEVINSAEKDGFSIPAQKLQGMDNIYKYLEENPKVCDYFYDLFLRMMSS